MSEPLVSLSFRPRAAPLEPRAVAALGPSALALARRLLALNDEARGLLSGVAGPRILIAIGASSALPWAPGVIYLGRDLGAPSLLVPTAIEPTIPLPLFERAVLARAPGAAAPIAILCDASSLAPVAIAPTGCARPIERGALMRWIKAAERAERAEGGAAP